MMRIECYKNDEDIKGIVLGASHFVCKSLQLHIEENRGSLIYKKGKKYVFDFYCHLKL